MHAAVRPYLTAGVALIGAGAIIASPVRPSVPEINLPALHASSAAVELAAVVNPIEAWVNVFGATVDNVSKLGAAVAADPAPILRQLIINGLGYAQTIGNGLTLTANAFIKYATVTIPAALEVARKSIAAGNMVGATNAMINLAGGLLMVAGGMFGALPVPGLMADSLNRGVNALFSLGAMMPLATSLLNPVQAMLAAVGDASQAIVNAMNGGDPAGALTALINVPAAVVGGLLNGVPSTRRPGAPSNTVHSAFSGLLTFKPNPMQGGPLQVLFVGLPRLIAAALAPPAPIAQPNVASLPSATAMMVSLDTAAPAAEIEAATPAADAPESSSPASADVEVGAAVVDETPTDETTTDETTTDGTEAVDGPVADSAGTDEVETAGQPVAIKDGNKAVPGEVNTGVGSADSSSTTSPSKSLSDQVRSTLSKLGLPNLGGKKSGAKEGAAAAGSNADASGGSDE